MVCKQKGVVNRHRKRDDYSVHGTWIRGKGKWFNWHSQNTSSCTEREGLSQSLKKKQPMKNLWMPKASKTLTKVTAIKAYEHCSFKIC